MIIKIKHVYSSSEIISLFLSPALPLIKSFECTPSCSQIYNRECKDNWLSLLWKFFKISERVGISEPVGISS